jgi:hypothetical protein
MATKGVIIWRGDTGAPRTHYAKSQFTDVISDATLDVFQAAITDLSDANIAKRSFLDTNLETDSAPATDANVDVKGIAYFRDSTTLKVHSFTIPAIVSTAWEALPEGDRLTAAAMATLVTALNVATGNTYTALYGVVIQKR